MRIHIALTAALLSLPFVAVAQDAAPVPDAASKSTRVDIELVELIERFSRRTGKQFIVDPRVRAQVPLLGTNPDRISYEKLLAILNVHQFAAATQGDWTVVVPDAYARQLPTPVFTDRKFNAAGDEIVTLVLPVRNLCAAHLVPVLRPLMPQAAHLAAYPDANTLIINDHTANARRIVNVIESMERNAPKDGGCPPAISKE